jgi:hypothetical protein
VFRNSGFYLVLAKENSVRGLIFAAYVVEP